MLSLVRSGPDRVEMDLLLFFAFFFLAACVRVDR